LPLAGLPGPLDPVSATEQLERLLAEANLPFLAEIGTARSAMAGQCDRLLS